MGGSTTVEAPTPINPAQVGRESLETQLELAPQQFAAEQQFRPQYAGLDTQIAQEQLPGQLDLYQQATERLGGMQRDANSQQRGADIADVQQYGAQAVDAFKAANPQLQEQTAQMAQQVAAGRKSPELLSRLTSDANTNLGQVSPLQYRLQEEAMKQLGTMGNLTPQEEQQVEQDTRKGFAARGLYDGNRAIGAEILNKDSARRQRLSESLNFAQGVDATGQQQINQSRTYATGISELGRTAQADQYGREYSLAGLYQSQAQDPYQLVLGRSGAVNQGMNAGQNAQGAANAGPQMFNPFNSSIMDIYAGNQANEMAARVATANNRSAVTGAIIGAAGSAVGGMCWVAREIYGEANPRWLLFRQHLLRFAPRELFAAYYAKAPALAERIRHSTTLREHVHGLLESILRTSPLQTLEA